MRTLTSKKQHGFSLVELTIIIVIIGWLASIAVPSYQDYMRRANWAKAIASTAALKLAITKCLDDKKGDVAACNDFSLEKLGKYRAAIPIKMGNVLSISVVKKNAAIRIEGADTLGLCILDNEPVYKAAPGYTTWKLEMRKSETDGDSVEKCRTYVKCG